MMLSASKKKNSKTGEPGSIGLVPADIMEKSCINKMVMGKIISTSPASISPLENGTRAITSFTTMPGDDDSS